VLGLEKHILRLYGGRVASAGRGGWQAEGHSEEELIYTAHIHEYEALVVDTVNGIAPREEKLEELCCPNF